MSNSTVSDLSFSNFQAAITFNGLTAFAFLAAFALLRPLFPQTYAARIPTLPQGKMPRRLTKALLAVFSIVKVSDQELLERCGHDAFAAVYYTRTIAILFLAISIPAGILLLPINATGGRGLIGLNLLSLGNVEDQKKLWAHFLFTVYVVIVTLYAIFHLIGQSARLRQSFQSTPTKEQFLAARTLMLRDVPFEWRREGVLQCIFERVCPAGVEDVILTRSIPLPLALKSNQQKGVRNNLEAAVTAFFTRLGKTYIPGEVFEIEHAKLRKTCRESFFVGKSVDAITYYGKEFRRLQGEIKEIRRKYGVDREDSVVSAASTAFIVFKEPFQAHLAARTTIHDAPAVMSERIPCIDSNDIVWENCNTNYLARQWRSVVTRAAMIALIIFWAGIVASVLAFTDLGNLGTLIPAFKTFLINNPSLSQALGGILPPAIVAILISLVPPILRLMLRFSGSPLKSQIEQIVFSQYFGFQLCNVVLVNIVGTSLLASFAQFKDNPSSILNVLATSIPKSASFFIQFLLVTGLTSPSGEILQIANLVLNSIKAWLFGKTPRTILAAKQPPEWFYSTAMASHGITITIGLVYCVVAPIVTFFVTLYFSLYTFVYLYQMQYVYVFKNPTGGKFMFTAANHIFVGLFVMEFMVTALFFLSLNLPITILMLFVVGMTLWAYSQARLFLSVIDSIPVKTILDLEGGLSSFEIEKEHHHYGEGNIERQDEKTETEEQDTSSTTAYSSFSRNSLKWVALFFPGLLIAMDPVNHEFGERSRRGSNGSTSGTSVGNDGKDGGGSGGAIAKRVLYSHPFVGLKELKVWIPKSAFRGMEEKVVNEIIGGGDIVMKEQVVSVGAYVNGRGEVEVDGGVFDTIVKY